MRTSRPSAQRGIDGVQHAPGVGPPVQGDEGEQVAVAVAVPGDRPAHAGLVGAGRGAVGRGHRAVPSTAYGSIAANSSALSGSASSAATFASSWATLLAPMSAEVTRLSRSTQVSASWARLWPRPAAIASRALARLEVGLMRSGVRKRPTAARGVRRYLAGQVAVGQQPLGQRAEDDHPDPQVADGVQERLDSPGAVGSTCRLTID